MTLLDPGRLGVRGVRPGAGDHPHRPGRPADVDVRRLRPLVGQPRLERRGDRRLLTAWLIVTAALLVCCLFALGVQL